MSLRVHWSANAIGSSSRRLGMLRLSTEGMVSSSFFRVSTSSRVGRRRLSYWISMLRSAGTVSITPARSARLIASLRPKIRKFIVRSSTISPYSRRRNRSPA
jgi:hypothetical protein